MSGNLIIEKGDAFKMIDDSDPGTYQALLHGCNCFCNMGAGFALGVKKNYPNAEFVDNKTPKGDIGKMGRISWCDGNRNDIYVVNAYTQYKYGKGGPHFEYGSLRSCIARTVALLEERNAPKGPHDKYSLIMPQIGCGYAGGKWEAVRDILRECAEFHDVNITVVIYKEATRDA